MFLTFRELREAINELSEEQLNMTASVYDSHATEVYAISECFVTHNLPQNHQEELDGVVEENQPLLVIGPPEGLVDNEKE